MFTGIRNYFVVLATLLAIAGAVAGLGGSSPQTVRADHLGYCDPYYGDCDCDPYDDDDDDDDCDYYADCNSVYGSPYCGHHDLAGFLGMSASPSTINCGSTTVITVDIGYYGHYDDDDYDGYYYNHITVGLATSVAGTVLPGSLTQAVNGRATFSYTAPANYKGPVYISASTEYLTSSLTIQVNCNIPTPVAPPINLSAPASSGGIRPPSTGDGGMLASRGDDALPALLAASIVIVTSSLFLRRRLARR